MAERRATAEERNADFFERAEDVLEETGRRTRWCSRTISSTTRGRFGDVSVGFSLLAFFFFNFNGRFVQFRSRREHVIESNTRGTKNASTRRIAALSPESSNGRNALVPARRPRLARRFTNTPPDPSGIGSTLNALFTLPRFADPAFGS